MLGTIDGKQVLSDALFHTSGAHPRIILKTEDFARLRDGDDEIYRAGRQNILNNANSLIEKDENGAYKNALCTYVIPDGIRLLSTSRRVLDRIISLSMAWQFTGKDEYAQRAIDELESAARFPDWNPYHFLDVGEMSFAFALGYDWLYHHLDEIQRRRLRIAIIEKGMRQIQADYRDYFRRRSYRWYQDMPGDNWKFICNGGLTAACLAIFDEAKDEEDLIVEILEHAFEDSYKAVRNMYLPDGSYGEGFNYWNYASSYLAHYTSALRSVTGQDYGLTDYEPLKNSAYYVKYLCSNRFVCFNFGDASENNMCQPVALWFAKNFDAPDIAAMRVDFLKVDPLRRISIYDMLWYDHRIYAPFAPAVLDMGAVGSDNASFRSSWDETGFYAAIHFGNNDAYHNHADTGTFVVDYGGKRFFCDLGADNYNVKCYRHTYRYRAEGHNTLVIGPVEERDQAPRSHCPITAFKTDTTDDSYVVCDMSAAYFDTPVIRGMKMLSGRNALVLRDEIKCGTLDGMWAAHTKADITLSEDGSKATLTIDGVALNVSVLTGQKFEILPAELRDPAMIQEKCHDNSDFKKLVIKFAGDTNISVMITPLDTAEYTDTPISEWK